MLRDVRFLQRPENVYSNLLGSVHIAEQIHEPYRRQEEEVNLPDQLLLLLHGERLEFAIHSAMLEMPFLTDEKTPPFLSKSSGPTV